MKNGDLLREAERDGYDMLVTTDGNLRYQQNLGRRRLAIVVLVIDKLATNSRFNRSGSRSDKRSYARELR